MMQLGHVRVWHVLKLTTAVMSVWMLAILSHPEAVWDPTANIFTNRQLEYTDEDGDLEASCDCSAILQGDTEEIEKAALLSLSKAFLETVRIPDEYYINATQDCRKFKMSRKYLQFPLSKEEEEFPLAYSMVVHHKVQSFERLLRAIYAPQNIYCVHVDKSSAPEIHSAIRAITSCFPNVFITSQIVDVVYGGWSRVQADLNCMADLYNSSTKWKYFINLCGQDFPLKTNLEIVRMLRSLRGDNSLESIKMPNAHRWRVTKVHEVVDGIVKTTAKEKEPPPFNLPILYGNAYIVVSRNYIRDVLEDERIQQLIEWGKDTYSPDEFLWATIQRMPGVSGSTRPHDKFDMTDLNAFARLVKWSFNEGPHDSPGAVYPKCHGQHVRLVCIYAVGDLQWLLEQHHFFANKFNIHTDPIAVYCLEKYLRHKALAEIH